MEKFAAIDFETANWQQTSVCSVGIGRDEPGGGSKTGFTV